ncbi:MAG: penicillin-binding protein 2 [Pseudomonadota bacterium]
MDFDKEITQTLSQRLAIVYYFIFIGFLIIFFRIWDLQILKGDYYYDLSENNRIKIQEIIAPRGIVYDRNGTMLANNTPSFDISLLHQGIGCSQKILPLLSQILQIGPEEINRKMNESKQLPRFRPIKIKMDVSRRELSLVEFFKLDLPNVVIEVFPKRTYPLGKGLAHVIGYLGKVNEFELRLPEYAGYNPGDIIGKSGIEKAFGGELKGRSGWLQFEVDAVGRKKKVLSSVNPLPGKNLYLTIDSKLQDFTDTVLGENVGTAIAMDPNSGEILAFVSHPSFDPNLFSRGISLKNWCALRNDPFHPLINRGVQGLYPPGSIFKIVTAIAGLEEGKITPETTIFCNGSYWFGNRAYRCWKEGGHGGVNLYQAIEQSCDTYFYRVGQLVGIDSLAYYAKLFGLGSVTGLVLKDEKSGLVPTRGWKLKRFKVPWQEGETLSAAIGQSFVSATPLQILRLVSSIATKGKVVIPRLVKKIENSNGVVLKKFHPEYVSRVPVSSRSVGVVAESLRRVIQSPCGTGKIARIGGVELAGKTGTAQVVSLPFCKKTGAPFHLRDHAWFVAYAPFESPRISVVVLVEHGGGGSATAGPIAREIINFYLNKSP